MIAEGQAGSTLADGKKEEEEGPLGLEGDTPVFPSAEAELAFRQLFGVDRPEPMARACAEHSESCNDVKLDTETPAQSNPLDENIVFSEASQQAIVEDGAAPAPTETDAASLGDAGASFPRDATLHSAGAADSSASIALHASPSQLITNSLSETTTSLPAAAEEKPTGHSNILFQIPHKKQADVFDSASVHGGYSIAGLGMEVLSAMGGLQAAKGHATEALRESQGSNPAPNPEEDGEPPTLETQCPEKIQAELPSESQLNSPRESRHLQRSIESSKVGLAVLADSEDGTVGSAEALSKSTTPESPPPVLAEPLHKAQSTDGASGNCAYTFLQVHKACAVTHE